MEAIFNIEHIKLHSIEINALAKSNVLIVGNAYGIMPYIKPLAISLHEQNLQPFWFAFSGQENTPGVYSYKECTNDIKIIIDYIKKSHPQRGLNIISHCAGSLMTIECLKNSSPQIIDRLIIYGLLFAMDRRRSIAERKLKQCNVNYYLTEEDWAYKPLEALSKTKIPVLFCHAKDSLNLDRASLDEIQASLEITPNAHLELFKEGYDDDLQNINNYIGHYIKFLNN